MHKLSKAVGHGLKHFFGARASVSRVKDMKRQFKASNDGVKKAQIIALMGMYAIYKGSPIGLGKNIADSIKVAKWNYSDMKRHQDNVGDFLAATNMSEEGKRVVANLVLQGGSNDDAVAKLTPADVAEFLQFETELNIEAGNCINF